MELEKDWVVAPETTLGADNGIGVAAAMAVADDAEVKHGPLELLFTVSEEQGLEGAKALAPGLVSGRLLVNLDGTSDRSLTIGCAGSTHTFTRLPLTLEPVPDGYVTLRVAVTGARGGHSGGDIARGRANAIKSLGRALGQTPLRLARLEGGVSRNALPREAEATIALPAESEFPLQEAAKRELAAIREQYSGTDDGVTLSIEHVPAEGAASGATSARALSLLAVLPSSVLGMNPRLPEKVETSTSLNVATTEDGVLTLASMTRSASAPALDEVVAGIQAAARLASAEVEIKRSYPPWRPDLDSGLLARGEGHLRAAVRVRAGARGRARRARVRGHRGAAAGDRDDLARPRDRRPARARRAAERPVDAALLSPARRAARRPLAPVGARHAPPSRMGVGRDALRGKRRVLRARPHAVPAGAR